jgi:amidohydrolase
VNDPALTEWSLPTLGRFAGTESVRTIDKVCGAEDFSFYQKAVPGHFIRVGCTPPARSLSAAAPGHSPRFYLDEDCLELGVKALASLAVDWLAAQ